MNEITIDNAIKHSFLGGVTCMHVCHVCCLGAFDMGDSWMRLKSTMQLSTLFLGGGTWMHVYHACCQGAFDFGDEWNKNAVEYSFFGGGGTWMHVCHACCQGAFNSGHHSQLKMSNLCKRIFSLTNRSTYKPCSASVVCMCIPSDPHVDAEAFLRWVLEIRCHKVGA